MRAHEKVLAQVEADLAAGRWGLGERLPAERALAEELEVSRASVREAMRILEAMGIVRTAVGSGPSAGATVVDRPAAGLGAAVRLHLASGTLPVADVVATRVLLETWALAEIDAGPDEFSAAAEIVAAMETESDPNAFHALDAAFHLELVRLAGNGLVEAIMSGLRGAIEAYVAAAAARLPDWPGTAARLQHEHREILDAAVRGDGDRAARLVRAHIEGYSREAGLGVTR
ncbi:FadR/GntR family transcriptional regulator [Paraoerskovia marina]|uniref:FadR/GntR family transcriptional regulator n=1 Tax=Paraoerskovia marina TaxID=545619 RepID=UPI0005BB0591|nr:FCD domain-containing protein [Paraoerskovia marina]